MLVERVESAGTNQRFDSAPVDQALVERATEIEEILERASRCAGLDDRYSPPVRRFP
jgi:hypothetical protein